ncbi:hypothetical protein [Winogradskyella schleiferi]|uniref:hypothetical protein n=1 Tax=Winogradskyella schleiferi TaxID=2686078 RepID=UPI0015BDB46B|nr:hypothetical protein [Winogradskyella schleiferi]
MKVTNVHTRRIHQPKEKVSKLFKTLATTNDLIWPYENWPAIKFLEGLNVGSKGGHGSIRYTIIEFNEDDYIKFQFSRPEGFMGTHEFKIEALNENQTEIRHEINIQTTFETSLLWIFVIRWLHDALIEDAFNKVENYFTEAKKKATYNFWVKLLREIYKRKPLQTKIA